ncbi:hypothetical protein [Helicobacter pylori]|nr:hypothetical protein [Helicobacter pylori]
MQKANALEIKLCKIPMIRDTEWNPNSPHQPRENLKYLSVAPV